ncbi:hypothetical protein T07_8807 [Trichinella nelsoni]|uniref:Uncharacterized protein n=1 Tax=Trichinella nelsoni TaxID=6336 RepID=A0A0V0RFQ1_9BILA|nr:hypothetical protein T07_8807 [Trichinella nelsoni]
MQSCSPRALTLRQCDKAILIANDYAIRRVVFILFDTASHSFFILKGLAEIQQLTDPNEAVDLAAVILMVWPHLESLKMIERLQRQPVGILAFQTGCIPVVLTNMMVTEEARTLLTRMEEATGKIFREFWKIEEVLNVTLDETFLPLIATLYLRGSNKYCLLMEKDTSWTFPGSTKHQIRRLSCSPRALTLRQCDKAILIANDYAIRRDLAEILRLTGPYEAVDLVSLTSRKIMQRLISGRALQLITESDPLTLSMSTCEDILAIQIGWIPVVLTTMMVTEEAPTLLTRMEGATGKIIREFWKIEETLKVTLDETFLPLIATLYLRGSNKYCLLMEKDTSWTVPGSTKHQIRRLVTA